ncbi:MAG: hypothetical protein AAGA56_18110 [Myxococcota bacterium]
MNHIAGEPRKKKVKVCKTRSKAIVDRFFQWFEEHRDLVLDNTRMKKGITTRFINASGFLKDRRLPIHSIMSEL